MRQAQCFEMMMDQTDLLYCVEGVYFENTLLMGLEKVREVNMTVTY